jgi:hypothetical protein
MHVTQMLHVKIIYNLYELLSTMERLCLFLIPMQDIRITLCCRHNQSVLNVYM